MMERITSIERLERSLPRTDKKDDEVDGLHQPEHRTRIHMLQNAG